MLLSLGLTILIGLFMGTICKFLRMPRLIGMLFAGILMSPTVFNLMDSNLLLISSDLKNIALMIILIKAGLTLDINSLKKLGLPILCMSTLPATFEILSFTLLSPLILCISPLEGLLMGTVMGAVSPAVVVPKMTMLIENNYGIKKGIPQLVLAGASLDDVFVLVLFSICLGLNQGKSFSPQTLLNIPLSIITGVSLGALCALILNGLFRFFYNKKVVIRNSFKVILLLAISFILFSLEEILKDILPFSGMLSVLSMAFVFNIKAPKKVCLRLSQKFSKLWLFAEILLFVLVGASVNISFLFDVGIKAILLLLCALFIRSLGVFISKLKTDFSFKERIFVTFAYLPKATVQAAIGAVPLSLALPCGELILSIAVLGIVLTAPLGAFLIEKTYKKCLTHDCAN